MVVDFAQLCVDQGCRCVLQNFTLMWLGCKVCIVFNLKAKPLSVHVQSDGDCCMKRLHTRSVPGDPPMLLYATKQQ